LPKSQKRSQGRHAALLLDQAGWHLSAKLGVPENITLVPLPPKCPELNPMQNIWQFIRDNWISNRIFKPQTWLAVIERRRGSAQTALWSAKKLSGGSASSGVNRGSKRNRVAQ
jgi:transposase